MRIAIGAQQVATTQAFSGSRLTLGVGVSHRPVIEDFHRLRGPAMAPRRGTAHACAGSG
jgi:alkanesulfonate monooxygenase SsuD/methylene tetrahydromethanopterin reductase-like flavin-dependent oxidoreductase (luciferase family)